MPHWDRRTGHQFEEPFRQLSRGVEQLVSRMEAYSRNYSLNDDQISSGQPIEAPLRYAGGALSLTPPRPDRLLANILDCAESIALGFADYARRNEDKVARLRRRMERLAADREAVVARVGQPHTLTKVKLDRARRSTSWRLMAPVRWFRRYTKTFGALD
jgi:hypothetical protein